MGAKRMKQQVEERSGAPELLQGVYAPIRGELEQVEEILRGELSSGYSYIDRLVKHGIRLGGKRLRPALILLSAKASGTLKSEHLLLSAAVEMIHTATLIHDDVLDEATLRRHLDTINARWDNEASILLGDYLFTRSLCIAASIGDAFACQALGEATRTMCEGELRQIENRGNFNLAEDQYIAIIADKTAALTVCCCLLGAHYAGADPKMNQILARFGRNLGIAFQITDDLLDLVGDEHTAGKSLGTDLAKQKTTLPLIRLLAQASSQDRESILSRLSASGNHHRDLLRPWFDRSDAIAYARDRASWYARAAAEEIETLPRDSIREALLGLTEFVVKRQQ
jgi:octaprenyl-diphosphate synthase